MEIKKLITGFLILSALTSSSVFLFSSFIGNNGVAQNQEGLGGKPFDSGHSTELSRSPQGEVPENIFVEPIPAKVENTDAVKAGVEDDGLPPLIPTQNLTDNLAQHLTREMVASNPRGPQSNGQGLTLAVPTDMNSILGQIAAASPKLRVQIQQEAVVNISDRDITISNSRTPEDIAVYSDAVGKIIDENFIQTHLETILENSATPESLNAVSLALEQALTQTKKLSVPAPLAPFQKSFLQILTYQKNNLALANNQDDPLRASLVLEASAQNYDQAVYQFQVELKKVRSLQGISLNGQPNKFLSALRGAFFLKTETAHAFWGIGDISFDPVLIGQGIKEFVYNFILETLKDRVIHRLVQQTINWVEGGGKPQFITNWKGFLSKAENDAAGIAIQRYVPGLCQSLGPLIRLQLNRTYLSEPIVTCTLDQVVQNVKNFYNDFSQGGWVGYGALILPSGNYFGSLFETTQRVEAARLAAKEAAKSDAQASGGFLSTKTCVKPGPSPFQACMNECDAIPLDDSYTIDDRANCYSSCQLLSGQPNTGSGCLEFKNTTPGSLVGDTVSQAVANSPISRIVNAQDIGALASAFVNSALNKLIKLGEKGLASLASGGSATASSRPPLSTPDFPSLCFSLSDASKSLQILHDFAKANNGQLHDNENFKVDADADIWGQRASDASGAISDLLTNIAGFRNVEWDPIEIGISRYSAYLSAVVNSLYKDQDLDLEGDFNQNNPPVQGATGVIRMTSIIIEYLKTVKQVIGKCDDPDTTGLGTIPPPDYGIPGKDGGGGGVCTPPADADRHPDQSGAVADAKASLEAEGANLSGSCGAFEIVRRAAQSIGAGLWDKPGGNNCQGFAVDIIAYPDGYIYDVLIDGGGANTPAWNAATCLPLEPGRYRSP